MFPRSSTKPCSINRLPLIIMETYFDFGLVGDSSPQIIGNKAYCFDKNRFYFREQGS